MTQKPFYWMMIGKNLDSLIHAAFVGNLSAAFSSGVNEYVFFGNRSQSYDF
jgi:hypothetical protein